MMCDWKNLTLRVVKKVTLSVLVKAFGESSCFCWMVDDAGPDYLFGDLCFRS